MTRRLSTSLLTMVALVSAVSIVGLAQPQSLLTHHVREATLNGQAQYVGPLPATQSMRLVLALPIRNQAALDNFLKEVYDPSSASYRQFLTVEEFTSRFGPRQADYDEVIHFAETHGLTVVKTSRNRLNLDVTGSVASIEEAFHLTMGVYLLPAENRTFYAPDREPTTTDLGVRLWHISGLDNYSIPRPAIVRREAQHSQATTGSGPGASFLGSDMRAAYYEGTALTGSGQSLGLLEYYGTDLADLNTYYANVGQTNHVPVTLLSTDGTPTSCFYSQGCDDTEQTLDMTQALGMAPGMSSLVMYVGSTDAAIFNAMATASPLNAQLSSSWTWSPADPSTDNPYFQEFAAQGQNLFQAAGDHGAWTSSSEIYPADDVYITSVGGTDLDTSSAGGPWSSETAWVDGGGGISPDGFAIPSWQTTAADGCSPCSKTYRNGPDVSANANFSFYVCADQTTCTANEWGGTSFAAPMWAGYLALVNQQAVANGNRTVGFINPSLYTIGLGSNYDTDFHDITSGSNGYSATVGYDLATGWGSPNGSGLISALAGSSSDTLTLTVSVAGDGSVTSTDGFIHCPGTCTHTYQPNTPVTLNATAASGWAFSGWTGACTGVGPCNITMTQNLAVTAVFIEPRHGIGFTPVTPCRLVDTRQTGGPIQGGTAQSFIVPQLGGCNIPTSAAAYSLNVTVVPHAPLGYLTIWPTGEAQPYVSTMNSPDGRVKANAAIVPAGASGAISVYATDTTDVILDIDGYFAPVSNSTLAFYPLPPCRVADTRNPVGDLGGPYLTGGVPRAFPILEANSCKIPHTAKAYSLNFTAVPHGYLNYLTVWPTGQSQPYVSTLNAPTGTVVANAAIVPAGTGGEISTFAYNDTDLVIDINGYFAVPGQGGLSLYPVVPCRVLDTRNGKGAFSGTLSPPVDVLGSVCAPPKQSQAYVFNATVVPSGSLGYLTLWPDGQTQPYVSTLNAYDGAVTSNMAIVPAGTGGKIDAYGYGTTQLILDISSYFAP